MSAYALPGLVFPHHTFIKSTTTTLGSAAADLPNHHAHFNATQLDGLLGCPPGIPPGYNINKRFNSSSSVSQKSRNNQSVTSSLTSIAAGTRTTRSTTGGATIRSTSSISLRISIHNARIVPESFLRSQYLQPSGRAAPSPPHNHNDHKKKRDVTARPPRNGEVAVAVAATGKKRRSLFPHEEAIEFELDVSFQGRKQRVVRTLPEIIRLYQELVEQLHVQQQQQEQNHPYYQQQSSSSLSRRSSPVPDLPRCSRRLFFSGGSDGGEPAGYTQLQRILQSTYRPAMERWFRKVTTLIPHDSTLWAMFLLWEPVSGCYVIHVDLGQQLDFDSHKDSSDDESSSDNVSLLGSELDALDFDPYHFEEDDINIDAKST